MKLTVKQKREIVRLFQVGHSIVGICPTNVWKGSGVRYVHRYQIVQSVLRDYMNGKFKLAPKRKK